MRELLPLIVAVGEQILARLGKGDRYFWCRSRASVTFGGGVGESLLSGAGYFRNLLRNLLSEFTVEFCRYFSGLQSSVLYIFFFSKYVKIVNLEVSS